MTIMLIKIYDTNIGKKLGRDSQTNQHQTLVLY